MSTKTLRKRIALVAVSALGFGLVSAAPSSAATAAADISFKLKPTGNTATADIAVAAATTTDVATTRVGQTLSVYTVASTDADWTTAGRFRLKIGTNYGSWVTYADAATTGTITVPSGATSADLEVEIDINATDGGAIVSSADVTLTIVDAGAPASVTFASPALVDIAASAADYAQNITVKDANGVSTVLLDNETIQTTLAPETGATATQVIIKSGDVSLSEDEPTAAGASTYEVDIDFAPAGSTGTGVAGTTYTTTAQLLNGTSAVGAPVSSTYTRFTNTSAIAGGTLSFVSDTAGTTAITSITAGVGVASSNFYALVKTSAGVPVKGATVAFTKSTSSSTLAQTSLNTTGAGVTAGTANTLTPVAGANTVTGTVTTGATSITGTLTVTATAYGATAGTAASWAVANNNGSGVKAGTAPAWTAAPNVTSFAVTISGLDASKAAKLTVGGTASSSAPKVAGVTGSIYPVADANGVITVTLTAAGSNSETATLALDAANDGTADTTLTITYTTAAGAITTSPAASSLNMATPSSTNAITASVADQYGNILTGGSVTITNTTVPAGVTAATAVTVLTGAGNTATVNAVVGATLGQYVFSIQAKDANGSNVGSASTVTYQVTTTGIAGSLTLADSDSDALTLTSDNKSTRAVVVAPASLTNGLAANTDNTVDITVTTATPAALAFSATATNGIRLFTTDPKNAVIGAGKSTVTGTAGTTRIYAVPTLVGAGTITVTSGGLTQVFTLTGALAATPKAQLVTLTAGTNANGKASYTVKTTDVFGNAVAADVNVAISGNGYLSNGFKNMTVTTLAADGSNSFDVISDGSSATGITATIASGSYTAVSATQATAQSVTASDVDATGSVTVVQPVVPVKSAEVLAVEAAAAAAAATAAADKAATDAAIAAIKAQLDAAAVKAAADKAASDAAIAAAQAAAVEAAQAATDAATEALDAANAATDAANASAEAGDAATAAAQDAADAVAALSTQVSEMISALKKQITALTNLVIKIQKKVKA
jgi:hypothetical protein